MDKLFWDEKFPICWRFTLKQLYLIMYHFKWISLFHVELMSTLWEMPLKIVLKEPFANYQILLITIKYFIIFYYHCLCFWIYDLIKVIRYKFCDFFKYPFSIVDSPDYIHHQVLPGYTDNVKYFITNIHSVWKIFTVTALQPKYVGNLFAQKWVNFLAFITFSV